MRTALPGHRGPALNYRISDYDRGAFVIVSGTIISEAGMAKSGKSAAKILVVEDEYLIATDICDALTRLGSEPVGPAGNIAQAVELLHSDNKLDGAIVDINLSGEMAFVVADELMEANIPFIFATGYDIGVIPPKYRSVPLMDKPIGPVELGRFLSSLSG